MSYARRNEHSGVFQNQTSSVAINGNDAHLELCHLQNTSNATWGKSTSSYCFFQTFNFSHFSLLHEFRITKGQFSICPFLISWTSEEKWKPPLREIMFHKGTKYGWHFSIKRLLDYCHLIFKVLSEHSKVCCLRDTSQPLPFKQQMPTYSIFPAQNLLISNFYSPYQDNANLIHYRGRNVNSKKVFLHLNKSRSKYRIIEFLSLKGI